jgi:hypothetical protein
LPESVAKGQLDPVVFLPALSKGRGQGEAYHDKTVKESYNRGCVGNCVIVCAGYAKRLAYYPSAADHQSRQPILNYPGGF